MKKVTPEQFKKSMQVLYNTFITKDDDPEVFHGSADELIGLVMDQQGFKEGMEIFWKAPKWYA